ncbi:hypothetical protein [Hyphomonas sp.]|jgi:copper resistance protein B|uniref:hypothetical protein n=1 Tax=Hyphomonas sp. TaxID=87 RepID=UPI0039E49DA7
MMRGIALCALAISAAAPVFAEETKGTSPPWSMADEYYDADEMAEARDHVQAHHGATRQVSVMADRLNSSRRMRATRSSGMAMPGMAAM